MLSLEQYGQRALDTLIRILPRLGAVVLILLILRFVVRLASAATRRALGRVELAQETEDLISRAVRIGVICGGLIVVVLVMGWGELALSFVAGLGITGLIVGFALQDITKNFAAGLLLLFMRPFRLGDRIAVDGTEGTVQMLALRATTLRTDDGREMLIPNATIYSGTIANLTRYAMRRHSVQVLLNSSAVLAEALPLLRTSAAQIEGVQEKPPVEAVVTHVTADAVTVEVRFWVASRTGSASSIASSLLALLHNQLRERGWLK